MERLRRLGSNAAILASAQIGSQAAVFVRNLLVVRALTPADFGIAATFSLALTLVQSFANLSIGTLVVQAPDGGQPVFQRTAQLAQALQGAALGALLFVAAPLVGFLFQTQEAVWCYRLLALAAVAQGLVHFDPTRYQRRDRFAPQAWSELGSELAALLLVAAALPFLRDYTIALWSILCQNVTQTVISHAFAERRYGWTWEASCGHRILRFGWPMLMSSILLYVVMQGDRFLIGSAETLSAGVIALLGDAWRQGDVFDKSDLALFSIAVALTLMPTTFTGRVLGNMVFPALARNQNDPVRFRRVYAACALLNAIAGAAAAVFFILAGENVAALIYTERYRPVGAFIGWLAVIQALRILRGSLQGASFAKGDSQLPLLSLVTRVSVLPLALAVTVVGGSLVDLALVGVLGEGLALATALIGMSRRWSLPYAATVPPVVFSAAVLLAAFGLRAAWPHADDLVAVGLGVGGAGLVPLLALASFPSLRRELLELLSASTPDARPGTVGSG